MKEVWLDIRGYTGFYQISNLGRVRSRSRRIKNLYGDIIQRCGKLLKTYSDKSSQLKTIRLSKKGKVKTFYIHILVAKNFIHNPNNYKYVIHKNKNVLDNKAINLKWTKHRYKKRTLNSYSEPVIQLTLCNKFISEYSSVTEAVELKAATSKSGLYKTLNRKTKTHNGFKWLYKKSYEAFKISVNES
jgi:hypothetical protein